MQKCAKAIAYMTKHVHFCIS